MVAMASRCRWHTIRVGKVRVLRTVVLGVCVLGTWSASAWAGTWTAFVASTTCSPGAAAVRGLASSRHVAARDVVAAAVQSGCPSGQQPGGLLTPIDLGLGQPGQSLLSAPPSPVGVAVTPDARYVLVAGVGGLVRDGLGDRSVATIALPSASSQDVLGPVAISPDGSMAYVSDPGAGVVWPVSGLGGNSPTVGQAVSVGSNPEGVAFSPDGKTVYVANNGAGIVSGSVTPITVASNLAQAAIIRVGHPFGIAITPDGASAYVTDSVGNQVYPIAIKSGNTVSSPIAVGSDPRGIAISPDGARAYVADYNAGAGNQVTPITGLGGSPSAGTPITLEQGAAPVDLALAPDGRTAYVSDAGPNDVTPVTGLPASPSAGAPIQLLGIDARGIAITPDQAPSASFTVTGASTGRPTNFDGSASSSPIGTIASYTWNFGDGSQSVTTTSATTSHVYSAGSYTARLTVTNSAGTSTMQAFTGQTVSRDGGPSATTTHSVNMAGPTAGAPDVQISPASLTFASTQTGQTSSQQTVTVTNAGNADLHVSGAVLAGAQRGEFALASDHCSAQTVPAGQSCFVQISFSPLAPGNRQAQLEISDDATGSPQIVTLTGPGSGPRVPAPPPPGLATLYGQVSPPFTEIQLHSSDGNRFTGFGGNSFRFGPSGGHFQQIAPGEYQMIGLPPGTYRAEGFAFAQGAVNYVTQVTLRANTSTRLDLTLRAANGAARRPVDHQLRRQGCHGHDRQGLPVQPVPAAHPDQGSQVAAAHDRGDDLHPQLRSAVHDPRREVHRHDVDALLLQRPWRAAVPRGCSRQPARLGSGTDQCRRSLGCQPIRCRPEHRTSPHRRRDPHRPPGQL